MRYCLGYFSTSHMWNMILKLKTEKVSWITYLRTDGCTWWNKHLGWLLRLICVVVCKGCTRRLLLVTIWICTTLHIIWLDLLYAIGRRLVSKINISSKHITSLFLQQWTNSYETMYKRKPGTDSETGLGWYNSDLGRRENWHQYYQPQNS
jgi:hypothetical protein